MLFTAIAFALGIFLSTLYFCGEISIITFVVIFSSFLFLFTFVFIYRIILINDFNFRVVTRRIILFIITVFIGLGSTGLYNLFIEKKTIQSGTYTITARVSDNYVKVEGNDTYKIIVDDVLATKGDVSFRVDGKVKLYVESIYLDSDIEIGDYITSKGHIYSLRANKDNKSTVYSNYTDGVYTCGTLYSYTEILTLSKVNALERFKIEAKLLIDSTLDEDYAGLAYGMLFGDKSLMNEGINKTYRDAGISHLLAVSGLHVGFVVTLLTFLLNKLKVNRKTSFIVITVILLLYVILCNFSISMIRAFIMTTCMLLCNLDNRKYDSLSSLSLALIIILLISPVSLFDIGLQMSFSAVLGIILLQKPICRLLTKFLYRPFAEALALSLAASVGVSIITTYVFSNFNLFSVFTNMIVIPIASISYMLLFIALIISLLIPQIKSILLVFEYGMVVVNGTAVAASSISINNLPIKANIGLVAMLGGSLVISSDYIFMKSRYKLITVIFLVMISLLIMFI